MDTIPVRRALLSVSDKTGLVEFARQLADQGVELFSTGGTRKALEAAGLTVRDVSAYTGFPEMMDGRLKTLHPKIFGGILCRHDRDDDMQGIAEHGIAPFELVVVNLYPFEQTIAREGVTSAEAIEQIDIGGPSLVRAAAKNHAFTAIATAADQYEQIAQEITEQGGTSLALRKQLAGAAFARTADYDRAIADYFARQAAEGNESFPSLIHFSFQRQATLRYGENPHQAAAVYREKNVGPGRVVNAEKLNGKELSYNNLLDLDAAWTIARALPACGVSVIKHNNPCGAASAANAEEATRNAMAGDPLSAFGSILGFNCEVDAAAAEVLAEPGQFVEAIIAPKFSAEAVEILTTKPKWKSNVRLMQLGEPLATPAELGYRAIDGGLLVQQSDVAPINVANWQVVTEIEPADDLQAELAFAWEMVRHVKSNAIVLCRNRSLVGAGAGQMSRVDSVEISISKSGVRAEGAVLASDAFFPFPDSIPKAAEAGVAAIIQPGGSKNDQAVIDACNEYKLPMVFTGQRHFKH